MKPIIVSKNTPEFTFSFQGQPSTGYFWTAIDFNQKHLQLKNNTATPQAPGRLGGPAMRMFTFSVNPSAFEFPHVFQLKFQKLGPDKKPVETQYRVVVTNPY